jgi:hypothetical protein
MTTPGVQTPREAMRHESLRFEHDSHPELLEMSPNTVSDFGRETFLNLKTTSVALQYAGEPGNADDAAAGKIRDVSLADD